MSLKGIIFTAIAFAAGTLSAAYLTPHAAAPDMVQIQVDGEPLRVAINEVTVSDWQACVDDGACESITSTKANAANLPLTGVNWFDVQAYISWRNAREGRTFRLPTAEEWSEIGGKKTLAKRKLLFDDPRMAWAAAYGQEETPRGPVRAQGAWSRTGDGVNDLEGNVWEWTASCSDPKGDPNRCPAMHVMGAHDAVLSVFVRNPASGGCASGSPPTHVGFRLVE